SCSANKRCMLTPSLHAACERHARNCLRYASPRSLSDPELQVATLSIARALTESSCRARWLPRPERGRSVCAASPVEHRRILTHRGTTGGALRLNRNLPDAHTFTRPHRRRGTMLRFWNAPCFRGSTNG